MDGLAMQGDLLVAHPDLRDPHFVGTVILLVSYGEEGAFGLILNRPVGLIHGAADGEEGQTVYQGGPVERGSIWGLTEEPGESTREVMEGLHWGNAGEVGIGPDRRFFLGYSGWDAGQLEAELARGTWVVVPATLGLVFDREPLTLWARVLSGAGERFAWVRALVADPALN